MNEVGRGGQLNKRNEELSEHLNSLPLQVLRCFILHLFTLGVLWNVINEDENVFLQFALNPPRTCARPNERDGKFHAWRLQGMRGTF